MKQPTQREARALVMKHGGVGAFYVVCFNKNGRPEVARFGLLRNQREADRLLWGWIVQRQAKKKRKDSPC